MPVVIAKSSILKQWRGETGSMVEVRSGAAVETLLAVVSDSLRRQDAVLPEGYVLVDPWSTPHGVAFMIGDCETGEDVMAIIDAVVTGLEAEDIEARIAPLIGERYPWPDQWRDDGFCAAMTIAGEPYWDVPGDPGERRLLQRMWDPHSEERAQVIDHAVRWCDVGGQLWLTTGVSAFKILREQAISLLTRSLDVDPASSIVSARDAGLVRRVGFDRNGFVVFEVGGIDRPDWHACVDDLTSVLIDIHPAIEWGFILRRPSGVNGIGPRTPRVVHEALWDPYEEEVAYSGRIQDPRRYTRFVLDVYGVQLLGPGHDVGAVVGDWDVQHLTNGRKLVSHRDPAKWFSEAPALHTLLEARDSFGALVDPIWSPVND